MPDIDLLQSMSVLFGVSLNELLAGQRLNDAQFRKRADENVVRMARMSHTFSFHERKQYWVKKWHKDHIWLYIACILVNILYVGGCYYFGVKGLAGLVGILCLLEYLWCYNRMMIYVEDHLYGSVDNNQNQYAKEER